MNLVDLCFVFQSDQEIQAIIRRASLAERSSELNRSRSLKIPRGHNHQLRGRAANGYPYPSNQRLCILKTAQAGRNQTNGSFHAVRRASSDASITETCDDTAPDLSKFIQLFFRIVVLVEEHHVQILNVSPSRWHRVFTKPQLGF